MNPCVKAEIAARDGDLRIFLLLGIANWSLFLDHIPHNAVSALTLRNFGFSGATELFVFVIGYAAAIMYGKVIVERGFLVGATRVFKRVWQLYAAYVVLFVIYVDLIGYVAAWSAAPDLFVEFNITDFIEHPIRVLIRGLLLQAKPLNLDVLQLSIVLMAFLPVVLFGMTRWPRLTMIGSIALYLLARHFEWNLTAFPEGRWYLNPFCWQLLFVLGIWFAVGGAGDAHAIRAMQKLPALRATALIYLLVALAVMSAGKSLALAEMIPNSVLDAFPPNDKENLAPYRVLHLLAMAFFFTMLVPRDWYGLQLRAPQPLIKCGGQWLAVFCSGIFLSFAGHLVLITGPKSLAMQLLVSAAGILGMTCVAYYACWSKRQDQKSSVGVRS
ncbi:OpgC domain-containing protein [Bradyrhizobium cenepequi]|uniref:OpgC domain-containing protein n=1 Tax=Bradyrhizobium cenepequi TaxID=2821403 RepID=UPI001CE25C49|nr:OpgC domain-containing protein [Bradyrhizobium cenepequi]MCA6106897.1 OpgC domain-containing protein [Bradyrhizobium cenepequi]